MPSAPLRLRCEFVNNPLGVANARPRFSWWVNDSRPAEIQSAYELMVASSMEKLAADTGDLWHTARVPAGTGTAVEYAGATLSSRQRAWWKVRTFDSDGLASPWSEAAWFELGLLAQEEWQGEWIGTPLTGSRAVSSNVPALRRDFQLTRIPDCARLYIAVLGDYRIYLNGTELATVVAPMVWSDYGCEVYYQVLDVTRELLSGENAIGLLLGDGYFAGALPLHGRNGYGLRPWVKLMLEVEDGSGRQTVLTSDARWRWRPGPILQLDTHVGEHVDARQEIPGWHDVQFAADDWHEVVVRSAPELLPQDNRADDVELRPQLFPGMAVTEELDPQSTSRARRNATGTHRDGVIYDFGRQLAGRVRINMSCAASDDIQIRYSLTGDFSQDASTLDTYTSQGADSSETFVARFAIHGFRYVMVTFSTPLTRIEHVQALRIGIPALQGMSFHSDHATLNKLFAVLENSFRAVAATVPMRGVTGEERIPDVGYAMTWVPYLARDEQAHALINKWLNDFKTSGRHVKRPGSTVPRLPDRMGGEEDADPFVEFEAQLRILWALYRFQGDELALAEAYPDLRAIAVGYRHLNAALLRMDVDASLYGRGAEGEMVATCTFHGALRLAAKIAAILDHPTDCDLITALADDLRGSFRKRYLSADGYLVARDPSAYVAALYHGLLDDDETVIAQVQLARLIQQSNYHAEVAPVVLHALLPVLTAAQRLDLAYMVLLQTSEPSWLGHINRGHDLIGYGTDPGVLDIAQVGIFEWLVESLVGISIDHRASPDGVKNLRVCPRPPFGQQFLAGSPVQFVEASLPTALGQIDLNWNIRAEQFELELTIPPTCTATVIMPDGIVQQVQSGRHRFVMNFSIGGDGVPTLLDLTEDEYAVQGLR